MVLDHHKFFDEPTLLAEERLCSRLRNEFDEPSNRSRIQELISLQDCDQPYAQVFIRNLDNGLRTLNIDSRTTTDEVLRLAIKKFDLPEETQPTTSNVYRDELVRGGTTIDLRLCLRAGGKQGKGKGKGSPTNTPKKTPSDPASMESKQIMLEPFTQENEVPEKVNTNNISANDPNVKLGNPSTSTTSEEDSTSSDISIDENTLSEKERRRLLKLGLRAKRIRLEQRRSKELKSQTLEKLLHELLNNKKN